MAIATLGSRSGSVISFDEHRGLGVITGDDASIYPFHCTGIADGSRTIDEGVSVRFDVVAGRLGQWEAWGIAIR
ncbi:MAG: cold-shock protein [Acidimicrobiales bacterium]